MTTVDYQQAYLREKQLRKKAEQLLEDKSRELYSSYEELQQAHDHLKQQQELLIASEKMASLGILSAGVAHEINNPLGFVSSNFNAIAEAFRSFRQFVDQLENEILVNAPDAAADIRAALADHDIRYLLDDFECLSEETLEGLGRVKQIVSDLKAFVHDDGGQKQPMDINECLRGAINILNNEIKYHARLVVNYGELPLFNGCFGKLSQVFTNLIANASQAIADDGLIQVTTGVEDGCIVVRIEDNGCGMTEAVRKQLFVPFFTTKPVGQGTGLGLSISLAVVEEHQGRLGVSSSLGEGSCFTLYLPLSAAV